MKIKQMVIQLCIFICIIGIFIFGFQNTDQQVNAQDLQRVREAVQKAALECYSIEGKYPVNVTYLETYYGLYLQKELYNVRYEFVADNIMPQTNVYGKGE